MRARAHSMAALLAFTASACSFAWDDLDPRITEGDGGSATTSSSGGQGGDGGDGGDGGASTTSNGGNGGLGGLGGGGQGGALAGGGGQGGLSQPVVVFSDDAESGEGDWTHEKLSGPSTVNDEWTLQSAEVNGGTMAWHSGVTQLDEGDTRLMSPTVDLTSYSGDLSVTLRFWHNYDYDDCGDPMFQPDGSMIEVAENGGAFMVVTPVGGYPSMIDGSCQNPLMGPGYAHSSMGWEQVTVDLTPYLGSTIQVGFHVGWDCGNCDSTKPGWYLDDLEVEVAPN